MILVYDGNPRMQQLIVARLAPLGMQVIGCCDASTALSWYRELHPDWVVLDFELDEAAGLRTTRSLVEQDPAARVLLLSASPDDDARAAARDAGARGCLPKEYLDLPVGAPGAM